jgi:hypothetical protein
MSKLCKIITARIGPCKRNIEENGDSRDGIFEIICGILNDKIIKKSNYE